MIRSLALFLLLFLLAAYAAESFDLSVGVKGGGTLPQYLGSDYESWLSSYKSDTVLRLRWSVGVFLAIGVLPSFVIQPECMYSRLGGIFGNTLYTREYLAKGLDLQCLLKWRLGSGRRLRFSLFAGPDVFFNLGDVRYLITNWLGEEGYGDPLPQEVIRVPTYGLTAGLGLDFPLGWFVLTLDARYNFSLVSSFTEAAGLGNWYQESLQVMFGAGLVVVGKRESMCRRR